MHATVVCICCVHNELGFATLVKEALLLRLSLCFRAKILAMRIEGKVVELDSVDGCCE